MKLKAVLLIGIILILVSIMFGFFMLVRKQRKVAPKKDPLEDLSGVENSAAINHAEPASVRSTSAKSKKSEVFHIRDNIFRQNQAAAVCKAFDAELASLSQLEEAYKEGADWCSYGWSKDGLALYPTQPETFKKLQNFPNRKDECGISGINGGLFSNKNLKFGVNCYGPKPVAKKGDEYSKSELLDPLEIESEKIRAVKDNIQVAPFARGVWSIYNDKVVTTEQTSPNNAVNNTVNNTLNNN